MRVWQGVSVLIESDTSGDWTWFDVTFVAATDGWMNCQARDTTGAGKFIKLDGVSVMEVADGPIVDKGTNYQLRTFGNNIELLAGGTMSTIAHTFDNNESIAVSCKPGFKPQFYVDGVNIGSGDNVLTPDSTDATVLQIGNNNELNAPTAYAIKQVFICNKALA